MSFEKQENEEPLEPVGHDSFQGKIDTDSLCRIIDAVHGCTFICPYKKIFHR